MRNKIKNIVLTGFMSTGKTTVGKLLAKRLNREFIDTDQLIEERQRLTIPEIFDNFGEPAFREMETNIAEELGAREGLVISTGGRLLLDPSNVAALSKTGQIFYLVASPQEILSRLKSDKDNRRPLLDVLDPNKKIVELLRERKKGYQPFQKLNTDNKQPSDVVENLLDLIRNEPEQI